MKKLMLLAGILAGFILFSGCISDTGKPAGTQDHTGQVITTVPTIQTPVKESLMPTPTAISDPEYMIHFRNGLDLFEQKRYHEAISEFNQSIALNSSNYDAVYYRGRSYYELGYNLSYESRGKEEFGHAIDDFSEVINHHPTSDSYAWRGWSYFYFGNIYTEILSDNQEFAYWNKAIDDFSQALNLEPDYILALNGRAIASHRKGLGNGYKQVGYVPYDESLLEQGRKDIERALELEKDNPWSNYIQGDYYYSDGAMAMAKKYFNNAVDLNPNEAQFYHGRAQAKKRDNDRFGAIDDFTTAINLQPRYVRAYNNRGATFSWMYDYNQGEIADYQTALGINQEYPRTLNNYAWSQFAFRKTREANSEALLMVNKAIELDPLNPQYHLSKAFLLEWVGDTRGAQEELRIFRMYSNTNEDIKLADMEMFILSWWSPGDLL